MNKPILLLLLCTFLWSCEYHVVDNTRLEFLGKIVDPDENPISDVYIFLEGRDVIGGFPSSVGSYVLGKGWTSTNGEFNLISLETTRSYLYINPSKDNSFGQHPDEIEIPGGLDSIFSTVIYANIPGSMSLGTIQLRRKADLQLKISKTSTASDTLWWKISYTKPFCSYVFENGSISAYESSCYETFTDRYYHKQTPEYPDGEHSYNTILGDTALFIYHIDNQPEQTVEIILDQPQQTYVFKY